MVPDVLASYACRHAHTRQAVTLAAGTRLGSYEVLAPLGAGGMGEVYRARDSKLDREVAIKVLPERVASDPETLARFEREAKAVAALSHPNILSIFDFGTQDGTTYAVTELLEGETLRVRLGSGALALRRALEFAQQVALGLAAAHEKGIVHRDLKPDNVFLTRDGRVKILDFGLARHRPTPTEDGSHSPTLSRYTDPGTVLGTVGYMSPEQVRGLPLDARSDIFSFGSTLYEMLTGQRAFHGETPAETMTAILKEEPNELASLNEALPVSVDRILRHCLEKDPAARAQSARDLAFELELIAGLSSSKVEALSPLPRLRRRQLLWAAAGLLAGVAITAFALWASGRLKPAGSSGPIHVSVMLPRTDLVGLFPVLSSDGKTIVYSAERDGRSGLWRRRLDEADAQPLAGTEDGLHPFFSADGQAIGFWVPTGVVKRLPIGGGAVRDIATAASPGGASWGEDGSLVFAPDATGALMRVPANGGAPQPLTALDRGEAGHVWPQVLPGGRAVLFTVEIAGKPFDNARAEVVDLGTRARRVVLEGGTGARYVSSGHLLYGRHHALHAAPFDLRGLHVTGPVRSVLEGVRIQAGTGALQADAAGGALVYLPRRPGTSDRSLVWVDRQGNETAAAVARPYRNAKVAPDGRLIVALLEAANDDLWVLDDASGALTRLTFTGENTAPLWSPDGRDVLFGADQGGGQMNIYRLGADGSGTAARLTTSPNFQLPTSVSPDGRQLLIEEWDPASGRQDIAVVDLGGDGGAVAKPFANTPFEEHDGRFSPDGRLVAYASDESGRFEIYVQAFAAGGGKRQISVEGGFVPTWSRDGREMYFRHGDAVMAVALSPGPPVSASKPRKLFQGPFVPSFDVGPDGRFLMIKKSEEETSSREIKLILGFDELLKRRLTQ